MIVQYIAAGIGATITICIILYFTRFRRKPIFVKPVEKPFTKPVKVKTFEKTKVEVYIPVEEHDPEGYGIDMLSVTGYVKKLLEEEKIDVDINVKRVEYGTAWICKNCRIMYLSSYFVCPRCGSTLKEYEANKEIFFPKVKENGKEKTPYINVLPTILIDGQIYLEGARLTREEFEKQLRQLEEDKKRLRKKRDEFIWMKIANADYLVLPKTWFFDSPARTPYAFRIVPSYQVKFKPDGRIYIKLRTAPDIPYSEEAIQEIERHGLSVLRWEELTQILGEIPVVEETTESLSTEKAREKSKEYLARMEE